MQHNLTRYPWHWLPPLVTLALVLFLHRDVPYHDQWDLLPLLDALYRGELHWRDLLAPHNGHVLLVPYAVMLTMAWLTHWNTLMEVLFGFACMLACWQLLERLAAALLSRSLYTPERLLVSLVVFSLSQAQNWLWGWQLQIPLAMLGTVGGFAALALMQRTPAAIATAVLCGLLATFSFAGTLPFWPAALPLIWRRGPVATVAWLAACAVALGAYLNLTGLLATASSNAAIWLDSRELMRHSINLLTVLGNLVARFDNRSATLAGLAGCLLLGAALPRYPQQKALLLTVLLFSAGSALLVSLMRAGLGDEQMLASRYATLTVPFWSLAVVLLNPQPQQARTAGRKACALALLLCLITSANYSLQDFQQLHRRLVKGAAAMDAIETPAGQQQISVINPRQDREQALREVALLRQYQLSHFRAR